MAEDVGPLTIQLLFHQRN